MTTATAAIHALAGTPEFHGAHDLPPGARCWLCAAACSRGIERIKHEGSNFTSQNQCRDQGSEFVCEPCAWCCSWVAPPGWPEEPPEWRPGEQIAEKRWRCPTGRPESPLLYRVAPERGGTTGDVEPEWPTKKGGTVEDGGVLWVATPATTFKGVMLRSFTVLHDQRGYIYVNKADKPAIRRWLREPKSPPWFAAIADSGQKHVLPWTPVNHAQRGRVRFEESDIWLPDTWALVDDMIAVLTLGVTKEEIDRQNYRPRMLAHEDVLRAVEAFETLHADQRGGQWWALALWLAQRDEDKHAAIDAARKEADGTGTGAGRRGGARDRSQGRESAPHVGADAVQAPGGGNARGRRARVRNQAPARNAERDEQPSLFGDPVTRGRRD